MPDASSASDAQWADYVFNRQGEPGIRQEWWYHVASGTWFIAERDNLKDLQVKLMAGERNLDKAKRYLEKCRFIGLTEKFEVWDTERWAHFEREHGGPLDDLFERLAGKGV